MTRRLRATLILIASAVLALFIWRTRRIFTPLFIAAAISYILLPIVNALEKRRMPRSVAILTVYLLGFILLATIVSVVIPVLLPEIESLISSLPEQTAKLEGFTLDLIERLRAQPSLPAAFQEALESIVVQVERSLARITARIVGGVASVFTSLFYVILSPVLAYFIMRDWPLMQVTLLSFFPARYHEGLVALGAKVNRVLAGFVRGQLLVSLVIGLIIAGGLALLGVRYALVVGLIAGAFEIIPYFGPIIGAVPAVFLALLNSPTTAAWTVVLFIGVNQLESAILSPKVVGDYVGLHPLTVILAILAGAEVSGVIGMLLAVPVTAVLKVVGEFSLQWIMGNERLS